MASVLLACPACKKRISSSAHSCPACGEPLSDEWEEAGRKNLKRRRIGRAFLLVSVTFAIGAVIFGINSDPGQSVATQMPVRPSSIPTAGTDQTVPSVAQQVPPGRVAASNIVKSRDTVVCDTPDKAQIFYELVQLHRQENLKGCWLIPKGKEIMVLNVAGEYAWVAPLDQLNERGWTNVFWLDPK